MKHFRLVDNLMGWLAFAIAAFTYCSTVEPTASFWDCPEFITTAYKLEVGHPPGAPFFMLTGNLFTQLTNDPSKVARMVNIMNALLSAACILPAHCCGGSCHDGSPGLLLERHLLVLRRRG